MLLLIVADMYVPGTHTCRRATSCLDYIFYSVLANTSSCKFEDTLTSSRTLMYVLLVLLLVQLLVRLLLRLLVLLPLCLLLQE